MTDRGDRPLVTFALFSFNQEQYVREALEAAFAQDYHPLEILVTDDCSTDGTFDIIQSVVAAYDGDHQVRVNRNAENLGVARHINHAVELARGDIFVGAAADDVSLPDRVSETVSCFISAEPPLYSVCTSVETFDDDGTVLGKRTIADAPGVMNVLQSGTRWVTGCSHAWHRRLFDFFGPLRPDVIAEDKVIGFRAMLLGGRVGYVDKELVRYRQHGQSISSASFVYRRSHMLLASALSHEADLETLRRSGEDVGHLDVPELQRQIGRMLQRARTYVRIADGGVFSGLWAWTTNPFVVEPRIAAIMLGAKLAGKRRNRRLPVSQGVDS